MKKIVGSILFTGDVTAADVMNACSTCFRMNLSKERKRKESIRWGREAWQYDRITVKRLKKKGTIAEIWKEA